MKLLALDTASELCSAALWLDGQLLWRETLAPRAHAALILPMIDELLEEGGCRLTALDAVAFGRGPGAFTGVRLAAAIAQGLGFAAGRPLIAISDLRAIAAQALEHEGSATRVLVCQDARMQEVYWGCFERIQVRGVATLQPVGPEAVAVSGAVELPPGWRSAAHAHAQALAHAQAQVPAQAQGLQVLGAGSGFAADPELSRRLRPDLAVILPRLQPRAREIARLAAEDGLGAAVSAEEALPVYLRDRVAVAPAGGRDS
ncbi:MAG TPA: tRNA (adenosine(37)-N6)-threonylcarbamoyltransferase complex dimerization subunit type 1 TsaB [Steroidobacteraceae bacterium]|nr:tRNA (adenosine(37)-N6)-threonylcarbamoyltransferase complex dimerization subunit type 1 TsaB [Steroidobacteraceae bacterium]